MWWRRKKPTASLVYTEGGWLVKFDGKGFHWSPSLDYALTLVRSYCEEIQK